MRRWTIMLAMTLLLLLIACNPHPTHPTKVECRLEVETRFSARFDTTPAGPGTSPGPFREGPDPCQQGLGNYSEWTQRGIISVPICVAAGTTAEQAATLCSRHLAATGRSVGTAAPPLAPQPPFGQRICPGSVSVVASQIVGTGGAPALHPQGCPEGTTWPLLP